MPMLLNHRLGIRNLCSYAISGRETKDGYPVIGSWTPELTCSTARRSRDRRRRLIFNFALCTTVVVYLTTLSTLITASTKCTYRAPATYQMSVYYYYALAEIISNSAVLCSSPAGHRIFGRQCRLKLGITVQHCKI